MGMFDDLTCDMAGELDAYRVEYEAWLYCGQPDYPFSELVRAAYERQLARMVALARGRDE